jgi:hypothetical protein
VFTIGSSTSEDNPSGTITGTPGSGARGPRLHKPGIDTWTVFTPQSPGPERESQDSRRESRGPRRDPGRLRATLAVVAAYTTAYATAVSRRLGDRLFAMNDAEAYWRGWQITKLHGGLTRRYHDPAFDAHGKRTEGNEVGLDEAG